MGAPERNNIVKPVRSSSPAELRLGCLRINPAIRPRNTSGGISPRQKPSASTGRRLSHQARNSTAASRPMSVGCSDMNPTRSQRVAPFDMCPTTTTRSSITQAAPSAHGVAASSRRRLILRANSHSTTAPSETRISC